MSPSSTKRGPGRKHRQGNGRGTKRPSRYVQGLLNHWAKKRREAAPRVGGHMRDQHGAVTLIGPVVEFIGGVPRDSRFVEFGGSSDGDWWGRRKWLGGISAQRGY